MRKNRALTVLAAVGALGASTLTGTAAQAAPVEREVAPAASCVGTSFSGTLLSGKSICNGNYRVTMQTNGDLVLRVASTGRACYASGTRARDGASATFHKNIWGYPYVEITSTSQGRLAVIEGRHTGGTFGTNANVNAKGEFWIGYKRIGWC